ncbi:MAG: gliding motility-associated C-terminal domain-containing protein, partial [Bacteroidales bacterium]|nr:gliding motility-associated C-terminal domain-containing protein [Bacteroidales bacterium]
MKTLIKILVLIFANNFISFSQNINFIENKNQWNPKILFKADLPSGSMFLEKYCLTYNFFNIDEMPRHNAHNNTNGIVHFHAFKMFFRNSNANCEVKPSEANTDYLNYFIGNDQSKWASRVRSFKVVEYENLYSNIDLKIYSKSSALKYDYIIKPGGNPANISLDFQGVENIFISSSGSLVIKTSVNQIVETKPFAYQIINGATISVECNFVIDNNTIGFSFPGGYDKKFSLIIDPTLIFSTYTGATNDNWGFTATFDHANNVFSGGIAFGTGYPVSIGAYQVFMAGGQALGEYIYGTDVAIIKYDSSGTQRMWATYLGGATSEEMPHSLVVDENNNLLVMGTTGSSDFPTSTNAYDKTFNGGNNVVWDECIGFANGTDLFISKLSKDGSQLLASTFVGGSNNDGLNFRQYISISGKMTHGNDSLYYNYADAARGEIITDNKNNVYVGTCTFSSDFPTTPSSFKPSFSGRQEGIVFKMDPELVSLTWSSYFGGSQDDAIYSVDLDRNYNVYVAGGTSSLNIPTSLTAYNKTYNGGTVDAFVARISADGSNLIASTYFGSTAYDQAYFVRTDKYGGVFITGQTKASGSTLVKNAVYNKPNSGQFIAKFKNTLDTLIWSTVFGTGSGKPNISITAFAVDICRRIYLSGWGREHGYFLGWSAIEGTKGMDITSDAIQKVTDGQDFYVMVMKDDASTLDFATYFGEQHNDAVLCSASWPSGNWISSNSTGQDHVDGGTSRFDKRGNIYESVCASCWGCDSFPTFPKIGAWSNHNNSMCNNAVFKINIINDLVAADFDTSGSSCITSVVNFINHSNGVRYVWNFGDGTTSNAVSPSHIYSNYGTYTVTLVSIDSSKCNIADTAIKPMIIMSNSLLVSATIDQHRIFLGQSTTLHASPYNSAYQYRWTPPTGIDDPYSPNPVVTPTATTTYTVVVTDIYGCTNLDTVIVVVVEGKCGEPYIYVPNAFTPNGDNKNDVLYVREGGLVTKLYFVIYDRWGEKVFETTEASKGWNGNYRGK